jgi:hypothetical protein
LLSTGWALEGGGTIVAYFPNGPVGGRRGASDGAAYAPRYPGSERGQGRGAAMDGPRANVKQAPGARGGVGVLEPNAGGDRHGQSSLAGPGTPSQTPTVDLQAYKGTYEVRWYNPRTGGALQNGTVATVTAGKADWVEVGHPPGDVKRDWVLLLRPEKAGTSTDAAR